ncbi:MAG TPA: MmgE/PrpD family protein [Methylomirabilota bacterium]|nr:MmgE/PrpD family protein [Methylomirabilota bacterium]
MNAGPTLAQRLAAFVCELDYAKLPAEVVRRAKDHILDQLGCQLLGSLMEWNGAVYRVVKENKPGGPATIVNYGDKVPVDDAALVNGTFAQGCEVDDYYDQGGGHPGAGSVPVALALAEKTPLSGRDFLAALAAGYELGWRIGRGLLPGMMRRGYHAQGVVGVFMAAATAGKIQRLNPVQMTHALAIAGSHASGTMEYDQSGGEVKRVHSGLACAGGMRSALLAGAGLTGPPTILEGKRGILNVFGGELKIDPVIKNLGADYAVLHAAIKRFPVNASQHAPIELLDNLMQQYKFAARDMEKIEVGVNEGVLLHGGTIYEPKEVIEAQFCLRFSLAVRLLKRSNDLEFYLDPKVWRDPEILDLGKKIALVADPTATGDRRFACKMKVSLRGEKIVSGEIGSPKGTSRNPLSAEEIRNKFFRLGSKVLSDRKLSAIMDKVEKIDIQEDVGIIARMMTGRSS